MVVYMQCAIRVAYSLLILIINDRTVSLKSKQNLYYLIKLHVPLLTYSIISLTKNQ